jgi:predicted RNA methylase
MEYGITKSKGKKHDLDKFYTLPAIAKSCIDLLDLSEFSLIIEPSAGSGSFSNQLPKDTVALDLNPEHDGIRRQDFFDFVPAEVNGKILVIGNPPFGQQNSLALKFINHAARFADTIAFIIPRSFDKDSLKRRIDKNFHLISSTVLPAKSFTLNGEPYAVPCIFQIWERGTQPRIDDSPKLTTEHFRFVKKSDNPDFSIRRIGGNAGRASMNTDVSDQSNYFIVNASTLSVSGLVTHINSLKFPSRDMGVGPRTISKGELITVIDESLAQNASQTN